MARYGLDAQKLFLNHLGKDETVPLTNQIAQMSETKKKKKKVKTTTGKYKSNGRQFKHGLVETVIVNTDQFFSGSVEVNPVIKHAGANSAQNEQDLGARTGTSFRVPQSTD